MMTFVFFILTQLVIVGLFMFPIYKLNDKFYRRAFYFVNAGILVIFQFYLVSDFQFTSITTSIVERYTLPIKKEINNWKWFKNIYYNPSDIKNNFIFIDTSNDQIYIANQELQEGKLITNRLKLAYLFENLYCKSDKYSLISCDVALQDLWVNDIPHNSTDTLLRDAIEQLGQKKNFIQAVTNSENGISQMRKSGIITGSVDASLNDGYYFCVDLVADNGDLFSPYSVYAKTTKLKTEIPEKSFFNFISYEIDSSGRKHKIMPRFIPEFYFSETMSPDRSTTGVDMFSLSDLVEDSTLLDMILNSYSSPGKPIILVGNFKGNVDEHKTFYGKMHGGFILANIYYSLLRGQHRISNLYLLCLYGAFFWLSRLIIRKAIKKYRSKGESVSQNSDRPHLEIVNQWRKRSKISRGRPPHKAMIYISLIVVSLWKLIIESWLYLIFFGIVIAADLLFNHVINILGLSLYYICFSELLSQIVGYELSLQQKMLELNFD